MHLLAVVRYVRVLVEDPGILLTVIITLPRWSAV